LGAAGIIVPQVSDAEQAASAVQFARYAPAGSRGVGLARAHGYGDSVESYLATANERVTVIVQAEHREAVENIESIVNVEGVDAVLMGPYDLSASLGKMGQVNDPEVTLAIDRVMTACQKANLPIGTFGVTAEAVQPYIAKGFTLIVGSVDTIILSSGAKELLGKLQS